MVSKRFQEIEKEAKVGYINFAVLKHCKKLNSKQ